MEGRSNKCARTAGTKTVRNPCRDCPAGAKKQAHYPDEAGCSRKLCAKCARTAGTYTVQNPCRDCPANAKKEANYPDERGCGNKLCTKCARTACTYTVLNPCRDCPANAKKQAAYPDERGCGNKLCAECARTAGTKTVQNPCRDCPANAKKEANYPDERGCGNKLCTKCARTACTYTVLNPCRDCPANAKKQAAYPDERGRGNKLCAECAFDAGLKPRVAPGASMVACRCWHRLECVSSAKLTHHVCCVDPTKWVGKEKSGLVPGRRMRPDAYIEPGLPIHLEGETSGRMGAVYLFHGNEWHGYPEGHPKHGDVNLHGVAYNELYQKTLDDEAAYNAEGYRVFVVWEHEYGDSEKARCPVHILKVVREV